MSSSPTPVTDTLSNFNDQMTTAARLIGRSKHRQAIFAFVYRGKKQIKTIAEISKAVGISRIHTLKEGGKMAGLLLDKVSNGYRKRKEFSPRYKDVLTLAKNKKKLEHIPTKTSPRVNTKGIKVSITFPSSAQNARVITVDDIKSFAKVRGRYPVSSGVIREEKIKKGFAKIIGERYISKDWGGEKSDLYSTRICIAKKRLPLAIAFKGKGTKGKLVPKKMGKNGDQVTRLFSEPAQVFLIVYCGEIDSSIVAQMQACAIVEALKGKQIYYGVIDANDLGRLMAAYPKCF